jgi:hypothetical protein
MEGYVLHLCTVHGTKFRDGSECIWCYMKNIREEIHSIYLRQSISRVMCSAKIGRPIKRKKFEHHRLSKDVRIKKQKDKMLNVNDDEKRL